MRIVEEFTVGTWKCTIFYHQQHFNVKIENGPLKQEYKFGGDLNPHEIARLKAHFNDVERINQMVAVFKRMENIMPSSEENDAEEGFDDII